MLHVYEFEVFEGESGALLAFPYDMEGGTQGADFADACESAADWLKTEMEHRAMHGLPFPEPTFGNEPGNGGRTVIVAVDAGKDTVPRMTAAAAARELGVTPGRVSQMVKAGQLETFEHEGRTWVTRGSVEARKEESPAAGRPRKPVTA
ncbi:DNA-binding protein [uncultured Adlercreutzia sp.]|uniref:DNA-binding protein n=1 Tax=uncultured Adlercreutzia sp. TaxID=875803 RepID=UPI0025A4E820|nr:DNA-binding protein [uncultured Adlercreutzia sp.]